ncbi:hypothetical protein XENORESO_007422 [Xenotaenia resolanae]|uniref:Uncharacterized protein n=1 Tax=Xenotaenia resolanae TaxID=208358 RepID=A0ABV0X9B3_9TELE
MNDKNEAFHIRILRMYFLFADKNKKARTCCSCAANDEQRETTTLQCVPAASPPHLSSPSHPVAHKPTGMGEKPRRPFFSASLSSPSPRSNPTRRRPIKHDSWDVEDGFDDVFSSNMEVDEADTDWPSHTPNPSLTMQL